MNQNMQWAARAPQWIKWVCCVALTAFLLGCGGGPAATAPSRFERTTVSGVAAVRDNSTSMIWAAQSGTFGDMPSALELLTLADAGTDALRSYFGFAAGELVEAAESVPNSARACINRCYWGVDFGRYTAGRLSNEDEVAQRPPVQMRLLQRSAILPNLDKRDDGLVVQNPGRLLWSLCTWGTTFNALTGQCTGTPSAVSLEQAKVLVTQFQLGGGGGWRLPTKQELQGLLRLGGNGSTLLPTVFEQSELFLGGATTLGYFTSSVASQSGQADRPWVVDFTSGSDPGGVEAINATAEYAYVRLVRSW